MEQMLVMTLREGIEAFLIVAIAAAYLRKTGRDALVPGAIAGVLLAAALAAAWVRWGHRVDLGLFFQVTAVFLAMFALQLLFYAFHEFTEANRVPGIDNAYWHVTTEDWAEGTYAQIYSALMVLLPLAWLAWRNLRLQAARA
jgi:high-affinity iron transporter